jgi:hypothetical protein
LYLAISSFLTCLTRSMAAPFASPAPRLDHADLRRFLRALRLQLWWRDALAVAAASTLCGALIGAAAVVWPVRPVWLGGNLAAVWLMLAAVSVGVVVATLRRPSVQRAARLADRQLSTASRLATAAEVLDGQLVGALAAAQLDDAWRTASVISPLRAYPQAWRRVQLAAGIVTLSLVILALSVGGLLTPLQIAGLSPTAGDAAAQSAADAALSSDPNAAADASLTSALDPSNNPAAAAQTLEELQAAAAQSQAAEAALQKLADALRGTSAARDVGEALRRGDYEDASNKLMTLGKDADQLSRISKRELANAMQRAAYDSAKLDPPLAIAEDQVGKALNRQVYSETRAALENLARAVTDAKKGVVSQEALAKSLDLLQQQQQQVAPGGGGGEDPEGYIADVPGEEPKGVGLVRGATSTIQIPGPEGDPRTANRSNAGLNPGGDPLGDLTSRLNVPPLDISVDALLSNDRGRDKANPSAPTVKISDTNQNGVRTSNAPQPGDPVQDVSERTIEPSAQRDAVRSFFKSAGDTTQPGKP